MGKYENRPHSTLECFKTVAAWFFIALPAVALLLVLIKASVHTYKSAGWIGPGLFIGVPSSIVLFIVSMLYLERR